jgi:hypothetical protein
LTLRTFVLIAFCVSTSSLATAQGIASMETAFRLATQTANRTQLARIVAADAIHIADTGAVSTGVDVAATPEVSVSEVSVEQFSRATLVTGIETADSRKRFLHVWVKGENGWRLVQSQLTTIATVPVSLPPVTNPPRPTSWPTGKTAEERALVATQRLENESFQRRDLASYEHLTSANYVRVDFNGHAASRGEALAAVAAGTNARFDPEHSNHTIRIFGNLATIMYLNTTSARVRITAVYVKEQGSWKQLYRQLTLVSVR